MKWSKKSTVKAEQEFLLKKRLEVAEKEFESKVQSLSERLKSAESEKTKVENVLKQAQHEKNELKNNFTNLQHEFDSVQAKRQALLLSDKEKGAQLLEVEKKEEVFKQTIEKLNQRLLEEGIKKEIIEQQLEYLQEEKRLSLEEGEREKQEIKNKVSDLMLELREHYNKQEVQDSQIELEKIQKKLEEVKSEAEHNLVVCREEASKQIEDFRTQSQIEQDKMQEEIKNLNAQLIAQEGDANVREEYEMLKEKIETLKSESSLLEETNIQIKEETLKSELSLRNLKDKINIYSTRMNEVYSVLGSISQHIEEDKGEIK